MHIDSTGTMVDDNGNIFAEPTPKPSTQKFRVSISEFTEGEQERRLVLVDGPQPEADKIADAIGGYDALLARAEKAEETRDIALEAEKMADKDLARAEAQRDALATALRQFRNHYPVGINPSLDEAFHAARMLLAPLESTTGRQLDHADG